MFHLLNSVAAFNGTLVGITLILQGRFGLVRSRATLGLILFTYSALLGLFVLLDLEIISYSAPLGLAMDLGALFSGALLLDFVAQKTRDSWIGYWPYALLPLYFLSVMMAGSRLAAPTDFRLIVACHSAYTLGAIAIYLHAHQKQTNTAKRESGFSRLRIFLAGIIILHLAQILRLAAPEQTILFDLVPLVGAAGLLSVTVYALIGSQTLSLLIVTLPQRKGQPDIGHRLDRAMSSSRAFLDPDISLSKVASIAQLSPTKISEFLNRERGENFRTYIRRLRLVEAKRLLSSPAEYASSIEAIALLSGFRSRSSFYAFFKEEAGMTPVEFRALHAQNCK